MNVDPLDAKVLEVLGQMVSVDDHLAMPPIVQRLEYVRQKRAIAHWHEGFRALVGERPQPRTQTCS